MSAGLVRSRLELLAVLVTAALNMAAGALFPSQAAFIGLAAGGWLAYFAIRIRRDPSILGVWGFRREGAKPSFAATTAFAIVAVILMAIVGAMRGQLALHVHMLPLLLLYPFWGYLQHLLMLGVFLQGLTREARPLSSPGVAVVVCAVLFGVIHAPDPELMAATCLLGAVFAVTYLKWRNLWALGLYHGWLGVFMYFWVLDVDPWLEVFAPPH